MAHQIKSIVLVVLQFICIALLVFRISFSRLSTGFGILMGLSILLAFWAIAKMQKSKLSIFPSPSGNATLVTSGPYRFIRHPMYLAVLIGCAALLLQHFTWINAAISLLLLGVLLYKLNWEEKMLLQTFEAYSNYCRHTKKLIPLLF